MNKLKNIIIVGIGETAEMAKEYFESDSEYKVVAFAAEQNYIKKRNINELMGCPVIPVEIMEEKYPPDKFLAFVALSYEKMNCLRAGFYNLVKNKGYRLASYVSSKTCIGPNTSIGDNCFIMENNVIQRNVAIGSNTILWSGNHIGHKTIIGNHVFLSSHVAVSGFCKIGDYSFLGINSCVGDGVAIGENCYIGGGVAIMNDTKPNGVYRVKQPDPNRLNATTIFGSM